MLFHEVLQKLLTIFQNYVPKDNGDVAAKKAEERQKIVDYLSPLANQLDPFAPTDIFVWIAFFETKLRVLEKIRREAVREAGEEYRAADLDGFVQTSIQVLKNLVHYWSISILSIEHQKEMLPKMAGNLGTSSILMPILENVREDDPLGILQVQLILFLIEVDIRTELQKAPKSAKNNLYSMGLSLVAKILPINSDAAEDNLKPTVFDHLLKMRALLLPEVQSNNFKYMKFIDEALNQAFGYAAEHGKGKDTLLKHNLNEAKTQIAASASFKQYKETLDIMCEAVITDSKNFAEYLAVQKKPAEAKRVSISEEQSPATGRRGSESSPSATMPKENTPPIESSILTGTTLETAILQKPEEAKRASISEEQPLVIVARTGIPSRSPSASPSQPNISPAENPTSLVLEATFTESPSGAQEKSVHEVKTKLKRRK